MRKDSKVRRSKEEDHDLATIFRAKYWTTSERLEQLRGPRAYAGPYSRTGQIKCVESR